MQHGQALDGREATDGLNASGRWPTNAWCHPSPREPTVARSWSTTTGPDSTPPPARSRRRGAGRGAPGPARSAACWSAKTTGTRWSSRTWNCWVANSRLAGTRARRRRTGRPDGASAAVRHASGTAGSCTGSTGASGPSSKRWTVEMQQNASGDSRTFEHTEERRADHGRHLRACATTPLRSSARSDTSAYDRDDVTPPR